MKKKAVKEKTFSWQKLSLIWLHCYSHFKPFKLEKLQVTLREMLKS